MVKALGFRGLASPFADYLNRIWDLRYFLASLVRLDLETRYRHSFLGIGWSLVRPVAMSLVFCVIFCRLFNVPAKEYAPFLLTGLTIWQFLVEGCLSGCACFNQAAAYIRQRPMPLALFPLRTVLGAGIHASISLVLAMTIAWGFNGSFDLLALLTLVPALTLAFILAFFMAILFGMVHVHFPDTKHLLEIVFQIVFYLTPVMYPPDQFRHRSRLTWLVNYNPLAHVLDLIRLPILKGEIAPWTSYAWGLGFTVVVGLLALWCLKKLEQNLVFWL